MIRELVETAKTQPANPVNKACRSDLADNGVVSIVQSLQERLLLLKRYLQSSPISQCDGGLIRQLGIEAELEVSDFEGGVHFESISNNRKT